MKKSGTTLALLAQFPAFEDWIINNLTPGQLITVVASQVGTVCFGVEHPLSSQKLGVQLWRAYRHAVVFELECRWGEDEDYAQPPAGCDRLAYFHQSVCTAIGLFAVQQPELLGRIVERQRREIEQCTGPSQSPANQIGAAEHSNRL